jgi:hypothetical protein
MGVDVAGLRFEAIPKLLNHRRFPRTGYPENDSLANGSRFKGSFKQVENFFHAWKNKSRKKTFL